MAYYPPGTIIPSKLHLYQDELTQGQPFRLLDLPGEIRNEIYHFAFEKCWFDISFDARAWGVVRSGRNEKTTTQWSDRKTRPLQNGQAKEGQDDEQIAWNGSLPVQRYDLATAQASCPKDGHIDTGHGNQKFRPKRRKRGRLCHQISSHQPPPATGVVSKYYSIPLAFLVSNRQVYEEALPIMYKNSYFHFSTSHAIIKFLSATPPRALQAVQALELVHETAGEPALMSQRRFKTEYDQKWAATCRRIRKQICNLRMLRIHLQIRDWPSQLRLGESWAKPILSLRGKGLERADALLSHRAFDQKQLAEAARNLELAMMTPEGASAKEASDKRAQQKPTAKAAVEKKPRVLVIKMNDGGADKKDPTSKIQQADGTKGVN